MVKWLLDPIAALGVYLVLITLVLDRDSTAVGLSIGCAVIPFQFVMTSAINAMSTVQARGSIIVNMPFPRMLLPLASVATESVAATASLVLIPVLMAIYGIAPTAAVLWLPVALAATIALCVGLSYPAALLGLWYPEYQGLMISIVRTLFFFAPGLVALDQITGTTRELLPYNPLTGLFESFRDALLYGQAPAAWQLLSPLLAAALMLAVFVPIYRREQSQLVKLIG